MRKKHNHNLLLAAVLGSMLSGLSCSSKKEGTQDCVEPPADAKNETESPSKVKRTAVKIDRSQSDWCRACVLGPNGFMSCQTVYETSKAEDHEKLKEQALAKACEDSGFPKDNCPGNAVIGMFCKDDPPPKDPLAAGKALLKGMKNGPPPLLKKREPTPKTTESPKKAEPSSPASKEQTSPAKPK